MPEPVNPITVATSDNTGHQQHIASYSTPIGIAYDFMKTNQQNMVNERRYREQVRDNRRNAAEAFARQQSLMRESERYNSVQNKVNMLREAGLNPALAYGNLDSASVPPPSADQAAAGTPFSAESPNAGLFAQFPAALSTAQDIQQKQITNKYLDYKTSQEIFKMIAETNKMIADTSLSQEQKNNLIKFRDQQLELLKAQTDSNIASARQSEATANYTKGALTDIAGSLVNMNESTTRLNDEKAKTEPFNRSNIAANTSLTRTKEETEKNFIRDEIVSRTELNKYSKSLTSEQIEKLDRENSLSRRQKRLVDDWCNDHGYDDGVAKMIYQALDKAPEVAVDQLSTWLDAGNWLPFVSNMVRNFTWRNVMKSDDIPPSDPGSSSSSGSPSQSDQSFGRSSVSDFEKHIDLINSKATEEQRFIITHFFQNYFKKLSELDQYKFSSEVFDKEDPRDVIDVIKKYKDKLSN